MSLNRLNRKQISDSVALEYYKAGQRRKQETGKSVGDMLLEIIYDSGANLLARVQAMRLFYEVMATFLDDDSTQELLELADDDTLKEIN